MHDEAHGAPLIDALARFGDGLPANVLPIAVNEVTQIGLEAIAAAFAYGATAVRVLLRAKPRHDTAGLARTLALAEPILAGLGFGIGRAATIETDDPDALADALRAVGSADAAPRPASFLPPGRSETCSGSRCESCSALRRPGRCRRTARGRTLRRGRDQCRGVHALSRLRGGLPYRRAQRQSRATDAAFCRGRMRAMWAVQGNVPGEGDHAATAARFSRRHRECTRAQGGGAVPLHPLQQAVRRQKHDRARSRQAGRQALDVSEFRSAST